MDSIIRRIIREEVLTKSNFDSLMDKFKNNFPEEYGSKIDVLSDYIKNYVSDHGFTIKFLNSCMVPFRGVRTNKFIIICAPLNLKTIGDFIYTIFHEIRHEEQISELMEENPLTGDLEDFEKLFEDYWKLELDADDFAKRKIAELILRLGLPQTEYEKFKLSEYIENYPSSSKMVKSQLQPLIHQIKNMKKMGMEYNDISDHPMIKTYLDKLENFF